MLRSGKVSRIKEFDGLRGLLAWWVVIGHLAYSFGDFWGDLVGNHFAVHTFIILSGFVITHLLIEAKESYGVFILRRWFRIYPVYILFLVIAAATTGLAEKGFVASPFIAGSEELTASLAVVRLQAQDFARHFVAHLLMLHGAIPVSVLPQADATFIPAGWSLSLEWQFYLVAPFIVWALSFRRRWPYLGAFAVLMLAGMMVPGYKETTGFLPTMIWYFVIGIASCYAWKQSADPSIKLAIRWFCAAFAFGQALSGEIGVLVWIVVMLTITDAFPKTAGLRLRALLGHPFLQMLGKQSYPVYIGHMPVYYLCLYLVKPMAGTPVLWGIGLVIATVAGTFAMAALVHRWVEVPAMLFGRRLRVS